MINRPLSAFVCGWVFLFPNIPEKQMSEVRGPRHVDFGLRFERAKGEERRAACQFRIANFGLRISQGRRAKGEEPRAKRSEVRDQRSETGFLSTTFQSAVCSFPSKSFLCCS